jgi:hypothetical protein
MASIARKPVPAPSNVNPARQDEEPHERNRLHEDDNPKDGLVTQELLLRDISSKLGTIAETSIYELRLLHSISDRISLLEDSKVEFIWNALLQTIGIIFVIIFGVFAVLAYSASQIANKQSFQANQLSLLAFCNQALVGLATAAQGRSNMYIAVGSGWCLFRDFSASCSPADLSCHRCAGVYSIDAYHIVNKLCNALRIHF